MSARIANRFRGLVPSFLRGAQGWGLFGSIVGLFDSVVTDQETAVAYSRIQTCPGDGLDMHARNSNDRRSSLESNDALRAHLSKRWHHAKQKATEEGLRYQLARIGYPQVELVCERDLREAGIAAFGGKVGYSFCLIRQPHRWAVGNDWDGGGDWEDGSLWGTAMTKEALDELVYTLQQNRPAGVSWRFVVLDNDGSTTYDGTGFHGSYQLLPINESWEFQTGAPFVADYNTSYLVA